MKTRSNTELSNQDRIKTTRRVTLVGAFVDAVLGVAKIVVGIIAHSHALVADGIHSLSDLLSDFFVLYITRISSHGPDADHPYGHERFETVGTVILGFLLVAVAGALAYENFIEFASLDQQITPTWPAILVAAISLISKEWIYHYTLRAGKKVNSNLLIANAWHSRSDAWSSAIVLVAVAGAMLGITWLDLVAAILVSVMIAKIGWDLTWSSLEELVDTSIETETLTAIKACIKEVPGVTDVHDLRSRRMGQKILLDLHIEVSSRLSVTEGHFIGEQALKHIHNTFDEVADITYHIDVENDQKNTISTEAIHLPYREEVIALITKELKTVNNACIPIDINLHYLNQRIEMDIFLPAILLNETSFSINDISISLKQRLKKYPWAGSIKLWFGSH